MDLKFVGIVKFDFCSETNAKRLQTALESVYGESGKELAGPTLGGGGWQRTVYGNEDSNQAQTDTEFQWVRTITEQEVPGIIDIVTVAVFSEEQLNSVINAEHNRARSLITDYRTALEELLEDVPSVVFPIGNEEPTILYLEPEQPIEIADEEGINHDLIHQAFEDQREFLNRFEFHTGGLMSLVGTEDFVAPSVLMQPWGRLSVLNRSSTGEEKPDDQLTLDPLWVRRLRSLLPYYRGYFWCQHRISDLREFDSRLDDQRGSLKKKANPNTPIDDLFEFGSSVEELRLEWTDLRSHVVDELDAIDSRFNERADESKDSVGNSFDIPVTGPDGPRVVLSKEQSTSIISYYEGNVQELTEKLRSDSKRIETKQRTLSEYIHELISLRATDENITLQDRIGLLTWVLVILTIILVVLTAFLVF